MPQQIAETGRRVALARRRGSWLLLAGLAGCAAPPTGPYVLRVADAHGQPSRDERAIVLERPGVTLEIEPLTPPQ
ncbi:MAG: hypothetical protein JSV80_12835, partial [Acidobacteriota bacterium]